MATLSMANSFDFLNYAIINALYKNWHVLKVFMLVSY